jgi:hypothetical protein
MTPATVLANEVPGWAITAALIVFWAVVMAVYVTRYERHG